MLCPNLLFSAKVIVKASFSTAATKLKEFSIDKIRNIGILAHIDAGMYADCCVVTQITEVLIKYIASARLIDKPIQTIEEFNYLVFINSLGFFFIKIQ